MFNGFVRAQSWIVFGSLSRLLQSFSCLTKPPLPLSAAFLRPLSVIYPDEEDGSRLERSTLLVPFVILLTFPYKVQVALLSRVSMDAAVSQILKFFHWFRL